MKEKGVFFILSLTWWHTALTPAPAHPGGRDSQSTSLVYTVSSSDAMVRTCQL